MSRYAEALAAQRNRDLTRKDIEWFVTPTGELKLRDCPHWVAANTKRLADEAERERQAFMHRQRYPVTGAGQ